MDAHNTIRYYAGPDIEVSYDATRCIHAGECLRRLPAVFDSARRPWILPIAALPNDITNAIEHCPSGALHYARLDGGVPEAAADPTTITPRRNGPLYVRGQIEIRESDGTFVAQDTRMALCRCGASANKPFCDNSHRRIGFQSENGLPTATSLVVTISDAAVEPTHDSEHEHART